MAENLAYARRSPLRRPRPDLEATLSLLGLEGLGDARPGGLSGGQRQRVALGRALSADYRLLLLDEPFSAVDAPTRRRLREVAQHDAAGRGAAAVLVTHDLAEAQAFGELFGVMDDGRVLQVGTAGDLVRAPATRRVAELLGYESFLPAPGSSHGELLAIHPDRATLDGNMGHDDATPGIVIAVEARGPRYAVAVQLSRRGEVVVHSMTAPAIGTDVAVVLGDAPTVSDDGSPSPSTAPDARPGDSAGDPRLAASSSDPAER